MRRLCATSLALVALALVPSAADAEFTAPELVSGTTQTPFEEAGSPALSANGRYVVFEGTLAGAPGVYRRDLQTGEVVPVASASSDLAIDAPDASAPSVSESGRYVAFTSAAKLDPEDDTGSGCPQVYVRDMELPPQAPGAYTLASALNGSSMGLTYASPCVSEPPGTLALAGAQAAPAVALSANGQRVVFTVLSPSNLTPGAEGGQVAVRNLETDETTLVSATPSSAAPGEGGAFPSSASEQKGVPSPTVAGNQPAASTAAISADGSTVAWLGTDVPEQVPPAEDVTSGMASLDSPVSTEVEPLWRRVSGGATERLLADAGLNFYFTQSQEEIRAVNGGTLYPSSGDFAPPVLSKNGDTVAVIANAPTSANEGSYRYVGDKQAPPADAYIVHVGGGTSADPQVTPLTATPDFAATNAIYNGIEDIAISADGTRIAFDTHRTSFALAPPTLISPPAPEVDYSYTYEANIASGTLQRVTNTYDGASLDGSSGLLSFSEDGTSLAFASSASNLIFGDPTIGASQVYVVDESPSPIEVASQSIGAPPVLAPPRIDWTLSATATAQRDGSVLIDAQVPGAGKLDAQLSAQVPASPQKKQAKKATSKSRRGAKQARGHAAAKVVAVPARTLAQQTSVAGEPSELRLQLRVAARYRTLLTTKDGLYCLVHLTFSAPGHSQLAQEIPLTLKISVPKKKDPTKKSRKKTGDDKRRGGTAK
jgi:hypothetical protein